MIANIHKDVQELIHELNEIGPTIGFGGYFRDLYLGVASSDIDIATNIPIEIIEMRYGNLEKASKRKTISGHDVFSFKMHRTEKIFVEIVCTSEDLLNKSKQADYTINSLIYDGKQIIDSQGCFKDMMNRIIEVVDVNIVRSDLSTRPYLWLKTIRLAAILGFGFSENVYKALYDNKDVIKGVSPEIMQAEGHKTLNGKGVLRAIQYLSAYGLVSNYNQSLYHEDIFSVNVQPHQKLLLLREFTNDEVVESFMNFYHISQVIRDKYNELCAAFYSAERPANRLKHQIITIKRILEG